MTKAAKLLGRTAGAILLGAVLLASGGCANTNNRDDDTRGASLLILESLVGEDSAFILSDVCVHLENTTYCSVVSDNAEATFRNELLNPDGDGSFYQDISMYRARVTYTRSDGRNVEGVDVPYHFDTVLSGIVDVDGTATIAFIIVRHQAKLESPLVELEGALGDEGILSTNTRCDFYGRDVAGNEHHVYGWIDVEFADFADDEA
jgi:hypothetical protein